jgi:hypothetical protein
MKAKSYKILHESISRGLDFGYNKTVKHTDDKKKINKELLLQNQILAIMNEICDNFTFDEME